MFWRLRTDDANERLLNYFVTHFLIFFMVIMKTDSQYISKNISLSLYP